MRSKTGLVLGALMAIGRAEASQPLKLLEKDKTPSEVKILADALECDQLKNVCTATGNARAQKLNDMDLKTISADKMFAYFEKNEDAEDSKKGEDSQDENASMGKMKLTKLEAEGNVIMTTRDNVIQGNRAEYYVDEETANVFGSVKITNQKNQMNGSHCQVNLKTGKYRMINEGSRVQTLVVQEKKPEDQAHKVKKKS
jgi:lipopolysaccharide export system protein LptA